MQILSIDKFGDLDFSEYESLLLEELENYFDEREKLWQYLKNDFFSVNGAVCYVLEDEGRYLSSFRLEPYSDGFLLTALETRTEERKKGHAFSLLSSVLAHRNSAIYSHVHRNNRASIALHRKVGFVPSLSYAKLLDGSVSRSFVTLVLENKN